MLRFGVHHSVGPKILYSVCTILGFWIPIRSIGSHSIYLKMYGMLLTFVFLSQSLFSLYMSLSFTIDSYITGVLYAVNVITIVKHLFTVVYFEIRKRQLADIYLELQVILDKYNYPFVDLRSSSRKITFRSLAAYLALPALFIILMRSNSITSVGSYRDLANATNQLLTLNETLSTVRKDFHRFFNLHSENLFRAAMVISTMSNLRVIAANGLLLTSYLIVAEQLVVLRVCLRNILYPDHRNDQQQQSGLFVKVAEKGAKVGQFESGGRLEVWQEFQQHLARILVKINKFASPITVISICCYVALLTLSAFAVTKMLSELIYATNFITGCVLYLIEIYFYCEVGHSIKKQADSLVDVIYEGPWLRLDSNLVDTLHFLTVDCSRAFMAKGGPFFTLSLEFFATVVSAVFTYFIVAIQIK